MPVTHVNRRHITYYLHVGKTKAGNPRYWFSKSAEGDLLDRIPEGYEVYENPEAQVFFRKIVPQVVTPNEVALVTKGLERYAPEEKCLVDVQDKHIVVYHSDRVRLVDEDIHFGLRRSPVYDSNFMKVMRFTLEDEDERTFRVQRWCFRGMIDDWIDPWSSGGPGNLSDLVKRFCRRIGQESFFELM